MMLPSIINPNLREGKSKKKKEEEEKKSKYSVGEAIMFKKFDSLPAFSLQT
jgi:hypothetical protein